MSTRARRTLSVVGALPVLLGGWAMAGEETLQLRDAAGRDLTAGFCVTCHSLDYIEANADVLDRAGWEKSLRKMIDRFGAPISAEDAKTILDYLADNY